MAIITYAETRDPYVELIGEIADMIEEAMTGDKDIHVHTLASKIAHIVGEALGDPGLDCLEGPEAV